MVLAILAGDTALPNAASTVYSLKEDSERSGLTSIGFSLAFRRLAAKKLVELTEEYDENRDQIYSMTRLTDAGWSWIENNESLFVLKKPSPKSLEDEIPF